MGESSKSSREVGMEAGWVIVPKDGAGWRDDHNINSTLWQAMEFGNHPEAVKSFGQWR